MRCSSCVLRIDTCGACLAVGNLDRRVWPYEVTRQLHTAHACSLIRDVSGQAHYPHKKTACLFISHIHGSINFRRKNKIEVISEQIKSACPSHLHPYAQCPFTRNYQGESHYVPQVNIYTCFLHEITRQFKVLKENYASAIIVSRAFQKEQNPTSFMHASPRQWRLYWLAIKDKWKTQKEAGLLGNVETIKPKGVSGWVCKSIYRSNK